MPLVDLQEAGVLPVPDPLHLLAEGVVHVPMIPVVLRHVPQADLRHIAADLVGQGFLGIQAADHRAGIAVAEAAEIGRHVQAALHGDVVGKDRAPAQSADGDVLPGGDDLLVAVPFHPGGVGPGQIGQHPTTRKGSHRCCSTMRS